MTKPLHVQQLPSADNALPVAAQLMMTAVLNLHSIVSKSHISHNCFVIIVFLYSQKFFWATITQLYIIKVLSFIC